MFEERADDVDVEGGGIDRWAAAVVLWSNSMVGSRIQELEMDLENSTVGSIVVVSE